MATADRLAIDRSEALSCHDAPTATTSNGEPPPESVFDSWALGACVGSAACAVSVGGATEVVNVPVAFGSSVKPSVDELEAVGCAELVGSSSPSSESAVELDEVDVASIAEFVKLVDVKTAWVLVACSDVFVLVFCAVSVEVVTIVTPGHRLWIPSPFWKTPMMLSSPASTSAHLSFTSSASAERPRTQDALHVAPDLKSSAEQPEMAEL